MYTHGPPKNLTPNDRDTREVSGNSVNERSPERCHNEGNNSPFHGPSVVREPLTCECSMSSWQILSTYTTCTMDNVAYWHFSAIAIAILDVGSWVKTAGRRPARTIAQLRASCPAFSQA